MAKTMTQTFSMALPEIMDWPTMAKTFYFIDLQTLPSQKTIITMSSTESKYVTLSEARREAFWLRNLYDELGFPQMGPIVIKSDNERSVILSHNPQFHARTKHIKIRHHWVRDLVNDKILDVQSCRDPEQTADILTKPLPKPKHQRHRREMGMGGTE